MKKEIFKDIKGFEGLYQVSNMGRVKSLNRFVIQKKTGTKREVKERILKAGTAQGYSLVLLCKDFKKKGCIVHRLVASAFIGGQTFERNQVNHKNGNKRDNHVENLEWCSSEENQKHIHETGLLSPRKRETHGNVKLDAQKVASIRALLLEGAKQKTLSMAFGVDGSVISRIKNNEVWQ